MLSNKIKNILLVFITLLIAGGVFLGHANAAEVKCEDGFTKLQDSQFGYGNGPTTNTSYYEFSSESLPPIEKFVEWTHDMNAWDTLNENMSKGIDSKLVGAAEACEFYRRAAAYFSSSDNEPEAKLLKLAKCVQEDSHYVICVSYKINHQFAVGYETILRMKNYKEFDILDSALGWVWNTVINNILSGLVSIFAIILRVVGWGIEKMMELAFDMPVILIKDVWTVLRDFVNMCFALVLVGVAVMNILQVQMDNYSIKKFIPNFVAAVILVNLSWVICWLVLDVGQIAYEIVRNSINAGNQSNLVWQMISPLFGWFGIFTSGALEGMGSALLRSTYLIGAVVLLCYLLSSLLQIFFAFAARAAALWLLFAISPLAWLGFVVPEFKGQTWDKFWKNLMELAFMPAVVAFFFSLGGRIITGFADLVRKSPSYNELAGMKGMGEFAAGQANSLLGDNATTLDFWQVILIFGILIAICKLTAKAVKDNELTSELAAVGQKLFDSTVKKGLTKGRDYLWKGSEGKTGLKGVIRRDVLKTAGNWLDTKSEEHRNKYEQLMKDGSEKEAGRELLKSRLLNAPNWLAGAGTRVEQKEKKLDSLKELHMKKTVAGREKDTNMVGLEELYSARLKSLEKKLTGMRELSGQGTAIQNSSWFNKDKAVGNNSYYDLHLESEKLMQEADELKIKEKNAKDMNDLSAEKIYGEQRRAKDEEWGDVQARIEFLDNRYRNNAKSEINVKISRLQDEATLARSKGQIDVWKQKNNEIENAKKEIENLPNFSAYRNLAADWTSFQGLAKQEKQEGLLASTDQAERGRTWKDFSDQLYDTEQTEKYVRRHQENFADLVLEYANRSDVHKIRVADSQNSRIIIENEERNKIKERMKVMAGSQLRDDLIEKKIKPNIKSIQDLRDFAKKSPKIAMEWGAQALVASEKAEGEDTFGRLFVAVNQNEKDEATKRANEKEAVELLLGEEARYFDMIIGGSKDKKRSEERLQNTDKIANNAASFTGAQYNDYISKREHDGVDKYTATEEYGKMYGGDLKAWLKLLADKGQYKTFMRTKAKKFVDDMELWSALCRGMYGEDTYATEVAEMEEADDKMAESARKAARNRTAMLHKQEPRENDGTMLMLVKEWQRIGRKLRDKGIEALSVEEANIFQSTYDFLKEKGKDLYQPTVERVNEAMFESKDALQLHSLFYKHFKEGANAKEQAQNFMKSIFELRSSGSENSTTVTRIRSKSYDLSNSQDKANYDATMAKINASRFANSVIHEDIVDKDGTTWHKIDYIDYNPRDLIKVMKERSDGTIEIDKEEMLKEWSPAKLAHWKDSIDNFFEKFVINKNLEGLKDKKFIASLFRTVREAVNKGVITGEDLLKMGGLQRIMADMTAEDNNPTQFWDKIQFPEPEKRTEFQAAGKEIDEKYKEANKKKKEEAAARREAQGGSGSDANDGWSWPAPSGGGGNRGDSGGSGSSGGSGGGEARRHDDDNSQARPTSITAKIDPKDFESWYDILENTLAHLTENYLMQAQRVGRDTKTALQGVAANFDELFKQVLGKLEGSHEEQVDTIRTQFEGLQGEMADLHRSINDSVYDEESKFEGIRDNIKECAERTDAAVGDLLDRVQYLKDKAKETGEGVEAIEEAVLP